MMDFVMMTVSFTVSILLATGVMFILMLNQKVMKWYMKMIVKYVENMEKITTEEMVKDL